MFQVEPEDAQELAAGFDSTPPEPKIRGSRQDFLIASYPWNTLKSQAHQNDRVVELVHQIDMLLFREVSWMIADFEAAQFFELTQEEMKHTYKKRADIEPILYRVRVANLDNWNDKVVQELETLVNRYLYLRMEKKKEEAIEVLETACNRAFTYGANYRAPTWDFREHFEHPRVSAHDMGEGALQATAHKVIEGIIKELERWFLSKKDCEEYWAAVYLKMLYRVNLMKYLTELGDLV